MLLFTRFWRFTQSTINYFFVYSMGLALSGALIGLTLLLIVDVHYRMNNGEFANIGTGGSTGLDLPPGSGQVGSGQFTVPGGGGGGGGETAENPYASNNKLSPAKLVLRQQRDSTILMKHDKVRYAQPSNISQIANT